MIVRLWSFNKELGIIVLFICLSIFIVSGIVCLWDKWNFLFFISDKWMKFFRYVDLIIGFGNLVMFKNLLRVDNWCLMVL